MSRSFSNGKFTCQFSSFLTGTLQSDLYRPFRFPTVLVGDSKLGGISTTLSAYESLMLRGYDTVCVLMFHNESYLNHEVIQVSVLALVSVNAIFFNSLMHIEATGQGASCDFGSSSTSVGRGSGQGELGKIFH